MTERQHRHGLFPILGIGSIKQTSTRRWREEPYEMWGSRYAHVEIWRSHHRAHPDPALYVVHHINEDKHDNRVCDQPAPCLNWACGNLALLSRADHIREHRPGRMGGRRIPNKIPPAAPKLCDNCATEVYRNSRLCRFCYENEKVKVLPC